jgi:branched-chain amino acid transport system ATP-binding protein
LARSEAAASRLTLDGVVAGYGKKRVLEGVRLSVAQGEAIALIGHNGAGKTTILRTIFGLLIPWTGNVVIDGARQDKRRHSPANAVSLGLAMIPAERFVFPDLTVMENLLVSSRSLSPAQRRERIEGALDDYPILRERGSQLAGTMSGGQQRMVSLAMALMTRPRLLLLDEPSLGLSPAITDQIMSRVRALVDDGMSVVLVEQNIPVALTVSDRVYVLRSGQILLEESTAAMKARGHENWWKFF